MKSGIRRVNRMLVPVLLAMAVAFLAVVLGNRSGRPFTVRERRIIRQSDSVMYVTVLPEDSVILRRRSAELTPAEISSPEWETLLAKMLSTVRSPKQDGVGIAAPQVGIGRRAVWVQRFDLPGEPFRCYLNPHLDSLYGEVTHGPEGCLSVPPLRGYVPRYSSVIVSYLDPSSLRTLRDTVHGYTAIIFQHECDHLDGILYIDRADTVFVSESWAAERKAYDYRRPSWYPRVR